MITFLLPQKCTITFLLCLVLLTTKMNLIVLKSPLLIPTAGSLRINACVARPVSKKELQSPPAQASMKAGWDRLRNKMVWDEDKVREWSDVAREAQKGNHEFNFGYLFGICVERNYDLPPLHPERKFKGRVVFQGDRVTNQNWEAAIFQDLGSCPAKVEASKAVGFYGLAPGFAVEIADAIQAYIQAELSGNPCWICLPPGARPARGDT